MMKNCNYVGIEIECISSATRSLVEEALAINNLSDIIQIDRDGSIDYDSYINHQNSCPGSHENAVDVRECCIYCKASANEHPYEFKVLVEQDDLRNILKRVDVFLSTIGAYTNDSCGLHVHLDMRNRNPIVCAKKLLNVQSIMLRSVPSERRENTYCSPVRRIYTEDVMGIGKYHAINTRDAYASKRTIEVRLHEGTVDMLEVYNWCKFLINVVDADVALNPVRTVRKLLLTDQAYLNKRIKDNDDCISNEQDYFDERTYF